MRRLLQAAIDQLAQLGVRATELPGRTDQSDGRLRIETSAGSFEYELQFKTKVTANSAATLRGDNNNQLILTDYMPDPAATTLQHNGIQYIDEVGNMHLDRPGLLIDIRGRRRKDLTGPQPKTLRAFRASGVRVLFSLLCEPTSIASPYRTIAERSTASLGTVQQVVTELEAAGYVYDNGQRRMQRLGDLFDRWVEAYTLNLWPKLTLGRFDAVDQHWWRSADPILADSQAQWGGETAANQLGASLAPEGAVIYADELPAGLIIAGRLRKADKAGTVEIRRRFWKFEEQLSTMVVPTPLVFADLLASGDPRQRDAADQLRKSDEILRRLRNH